ncbi:MAG TPA: ABC transporter permease [Candidatus Xenobia bacterium]|nr:ABC transporter permease [Candidatus Xenobia bacterium]
MRLGHAGIVFRKELTDVLRDRRTIVTTIVVPILAFPLLMGGMIGLMIFFARQAERQTAPVMLLGAESAPTLAQKLSEQEGFTIVPAADDYVQRINDKQLRAAVEFPPALEEKVRTTPEETQTVSIYHFEGELRSRSALRTIERAVRDYRDQAVAERLAARGLSTELLKPFEWKRENVASAEKVTGVIVGFIVPYLVILFTLTGAIYPAIDVTAGEKERGTIETILASAVSRLELVTGKFLLVFCTSTLTTVLSIGSMAVVVLAGAEYLGRLTGGFVIALSGKAAATVFLLVLPLAVLFSGVLLAVALLARNYREAQSYTTPIVFLAMLPAVASFIPGLELNAKLALVPILNVSLVAREIFTGQYNWSLIGLVFLSSCVYAGVALWFAARQFNREEVLFRT